MQDFIVTKRAANGEREEVQYTAADRAALFSQLKAEGVNAISIREGKLDSRKARKPSRKPASSKARSPLRGLLAGLIVIVGAAAIYYFFLMPKPQQVETVRDKKQELIKEVVPAVVTNVAEVVTNAPAPAVVTNFVNGVWRDPEGRPHYKPARVIKLGSNTIINGQPWVPPRPIFHHMSEVELDRVLSGKPGDRIIGETNWKLFEKDLRESMIEPIRIDPEDTPEEIERKNLVKDAKKELAAAIGDGEDPCKILKEAQENMNKLADLYDGLNRDLYEIRASGEATEQEIEDYVAAANKMLEKNNILTKRFMTPKEIREKAEAANRRRLEKLSEQNQN